MRNSLTPRILLILSLVTTSLVVGCSSDDSVAPDTNTNPSEIQAIVEAAGTLAPLSADRDDVTTRTETEGNYQVTYETHDRVDNITNVAYLGLNDDIIWPGSLIKGTEAHNFVYNPITVPRSPVTLSLSLETAVTGDSITINVPDPKLSTIRQGISDLLAVAIVGETSVPAKVEFSHEQVYSKSHMSLSIDADVSYGLGSLDSAFDWDSTSETTKIVAKYKQLYFSVDMDTPQSSAAVFPADISPSVLREGMPEGSMPLYVAGVTYGMMAVMTIETSYSYETMKLAIDAAYSGAVDTQIETEGTAEEMLRSSSIRIVVYGGSTQGLSEIELGFAGFMKIVEASTTFAPSSPGVPLVYKFRHLRDNTLAQVSMTSQYTLSRAVKWAQKIRVTAVNFYCSMADDEGLDNTIDMDRFNLKISAWVRADANASYIPLPGVANAYVFNWSTPGEYNMDAGDTFTCSEPNTFNLTMNTKDFDFDLARFSFSAYARDYDGSGANHEDDTGTLTLIGGTNFLANNGNHSITLESEDFRIVANFRIELVD